MAKQLTLKRFREIVESYGATPGRWPEAERAAARALVKTTPEARKIAESQARIDRALSAVPRPAAADAAFLKRLGTIPHRDSRGAKPRAGKAPLFAVFGVKSLIPQGLAIAAAGAFGIWLGLHSGLAGPQTVVEIDAGSYFAYNPDLEKDLEKFE